jgi:hypothetical protein
MDMVQWIAGFNNMALAAAANEVMNKWSRAGFLCCMLHVPCQVWTYTASMAHLRICMEIAASPGDKQGPSLAQVYDEKCRSTWSMKAFRGSPFVHLGGTADSWHYDLLLTGDYTSKECIQTLSETKDLGILEQARRHVSQFVSFMSFPALCVVAVSTTPLAKRNLYR